jgi:hypothetical protein
MNKPLKTKLSLMHEDLLEGKLPRNLPWAEAVELIERLGKVEPHGGVEFAFVVGTQRAFFKRPHTHDLDVEEVARLRKFLRNAGADLEHGKVISQPCRMIVVIDHHSAHVYFDFNKSRPQNEMIEKPLDPSHFHHHLSHRKEANYKGERVPEDTVFYEQISKDLLDADEIVLIGHGTGKSSAAQFLLEYLKTHHVETFQRVIATETADLSALTEPEIEKIAKSHMIMIAPASVTS